MLRIDGLLTTAISAKLPIEHNGNANRLCWIQYFIIFKNHPTKDLFPLSLHLSMACIKAKAKAKSKAIAKLNNVRFFLNVPRTGKEHRMWAIYVYSNKLARIDHQFQWFSIRKLFFFVVFFFYLLLFPKQKMRIFMCVFNVYSRPLQLSNWQNALVIIAIL